MVGRLNGGGGLVIGGEGLGGGGHGSRGGERIRGEMAAAGGLAGRVELGPARLVHLGGEAEEEKEEGDDEANAVEESTGVGGVDDVAKVAMHDAQQEH